MNLKLYQKSKNGLLESIKRSAGQQKRSIKAIISKIEIWSKLCLINVLINKIDKLETFDYGTQRNEDEETKKNQ